MVWFSILKSRYILYHKGRYIFVGTALILLLLILRLIFPSKDYSTDRNQQLKNIAKSIESGSNNKQWVGKKACRHPRLDVDSPEMMQFIKYQPPIECNTEEDWVEVVGSTARITAQARRRYGEIECSFTDVEWANDYSTRAGLTTTTHTEYNLESTDFARVNCASDSGKKWWSIIAGVRHDQDIMDRTGWHLLPHDSLKLNVLMFGFDSLSHNTFIRKLPKSYAYLKDTLKAVVLNGYNIVGDGTPQALIPILTGKTELELPDTRRRMGEKASYVNVYPFIWNEFRKNGYVTAFMEDTPNVGIFTYRLKGFGELPTDHYMRTFFNEAYPDYSRFINLCIGNIPRHKIMLEYMKHLYRVYRERPKFMFGFHGEISHDDYNLVGGADRDLESWLTWLHTMGHLNNTLLILMSDHGHRFAAVRNTQQGKLEERLPWFSLVLPEWLERREPAVVAALKANADALTTPFDIHATLRSVLAYKGPQYQQSRTQRSLSLFHKIPDERTCGDAYIEPHWCTCLDWEVIRPSHDLAVKAGQKFVDFINKYNAKFTKQCAILKVNRVEWAARLIPSDAVRQFQHSADLDGFVPKMGSKSDLSSETYQVKVVAVPGEGIFEFSTVRNLTTNHFTFRIEDVSRINQYGDQARCIENTFEQLRKFCYCL